MQDLLASLLSTLQTLTILLATQGNLPPELAARVHTQLSTQYSPAVTTQAHKQDSLNIINQKKAGAVINILCLAGDNLHSGTASGVIVSPTGLVLTNAHIAQYVLLEQASDAKVRCTLRIGAPAKTAYKAQVVYISKSWITKNASQITHTEQYGTGEDDYAILQIIESIDNTKLPKAFTYIQPSGLSSAIKNGQSVLVRAYPAEFLGSNITMRSLYPTATVTQVQSRATFNDQTNKHPIVDLISLGGNILAQGGSSGGAVITQDGKLAGIIVTSTHAKETKDRELKAITLNHINSSLTAEAGVTLESLLKTPTQDILTKYTDELKESAEALIKFINN